MIMNDLSDSATDWYWLFKKVLMLAVFGAGLALVFEPDHTSNLPILAAFGLWSTHILFAATLFLSGVWALQRLGLIAPVSAIMSGCLLPALFAPVSLLLDYGFGNPDEEILAAQGPIAVYLNETMAVTPVALTVALVVTFVLYREGLKQPTPANSTEEPSLRIIFKDLPRSLGNDIIRMHAQDHYVEVITTQGSALLTEHFGKCVQKLDQLNGIQCHRSHWINLAHAKGVARSGSAYNCIMSNDERVPVSRRRYAELRYKLDTGTLVPSSS